MRRPREQTGQSTLEWVVGAAVILGTLVTGIMTWNQGLADKMRALVTQVTGTH